MPHFTLQISPQGPIVQAYFGVSQPRRAALAQAGQPLPAAQLVTALIDTGASCTAVDPSVIAALNLQPTGRAMVITPSTGTTPHQTDQYDVSLFIPGQTTASPPFVLQTTPVLTAQLLQPQGFHALIGRDILNRCFLAYNGTIGLFTLAY